MSALTKNLIYFGTAIFLIAGFPGLMMLFAETVPFFMFLPVIVGIGMIVGRGISIYVDYVTHKTERTKDLDYPDPTIIDITGIKYREDKPPKE